VTGPEHYREAERLITVARKADRDDLYGQYTETQAAIILADAQVHATLAAAAAGALGTSSAEGRAWAEVAGTGMQAPTWPGELDDVPRRPGT
jgi:hypothetical protein